MKSYPLILTAAEVRAVLNGTKTQHRVRVKPQPVGAVMGQRVLYSTHAPDVGKFVFLDREDVAMARVIAHARCPFGVPGDTLWVREGIKRCQHIDGPWHTLPEDRIDAAYYLADGELADNLDFWPWSRSFLPLCPYGLSRILLEVVSVRVQRLQDISEEDARVSGLEDLESDRAQGIIDTPDWSVCEQCGGTRLYTSLGPNLGACFDTDCLECDTYRKRFRNAWRFKHGADSWSRNDWVFALTFKRAEGER